MRVTTVFILILLATLRAESQHVNIIPQPASVKLENSAPAFFITASTLIVLEGSGMENSHRFLNAYLLKNYSFQLKVVKSSSSNNAIRLNYERMEKEFTGAYNMTINNKGVYIAGDNEEGVFYGVQTLLQLLPIRDPIPITTG